MIRKCRASRKVDAPQKPAAGHASVTIGTYGLKVTNMLSGGEAKQFEELLHLALQAVVLGIDGRLRFQGTAVEVTAAGEERGGEGKLGVFRL